MADEGLVVPLAAQQRHQARRVAALDGQRADLDAVAEAAARDHPFQVRVLRPVANAFAESVGTRSGSAAIMAMLGCFVRRERGAQRRASQSVAEPSLVARDLRTSAMPGALGVGRADRRRPVTIDGGEHAAGAQDAGNLGERRVGLHPVQRLYGDDDVGRAVGQTGGVRPTGRVADVAGTRHAGARRLRSHVVARLDADDVRRPGCGPSCRQSSATAEIDHHGRALDGGVRAQQRRQLGGRRRTDRVVEIGEPTEATRVRL